MRIGWRTPFSGPSASSEKPKMDANLHLAFLKIDGPNREGRGGAAVSQLEIPPALGPRVRLRDPNLVGVMGLKPHARNRHAKA